MNAISNMWDRARALAWLVENKLPERLKASLSQLLATVRADERSKTASEDKPGRHGIWHLNEK